MMFEDPKTSALRACLNCPFDQQELVLNLLFDILESVDRAIVSREGQNPWNNCIAIDHS